MLNSYSQRFAERLFAAHPEWRPLERVERNGDLTVSIPSLYDGGCALNIYTEGEITISYDKWHTHFDEMGDIEEEGFVDALEFIDALLAEKVCIVVRQRADGSVISSGITDPKKAPVVEGDAVRVYVRSWRGTYDKEYLRSDR